MGGRRDGNRAGPRRLEHGSNHATWRADARQLSASSGQFAGRTTQFSRTCCRTADWCVSVATNAPTGTSDTPARLDSTSRGPRHFARRQGRRTRQACHSSTGTDSYTPTGRALGLAKHDPGRSGAPRSAATPLHGSVAESVGSGFVGRQAWRSARRSRNAARRRPVAGGRSVRRHRSGRPRSRAGAVRSPRRPSRCTGGVRASRGVGVVPVAVALDHDPGPLRQQQKEVHALSGQRRGRGSVAGAGVRVVVQIHLGNQGRNVRAEADAAFHMDARRPPAGAGRRAGARARAARTRPGAPAGEHEPPRNRLTPASAGSPRFPRVDRACHWGGGGLAHGSPRPRSCGPCNRRLGKAPALRAFEFFSSSPGKGGANRIAGGHAYGPGEVVLDGGGTDRRRDTASRRVPASVVVNRSPSPRLRHHEVSDRDDPRRGDHHHGRPQQTGPRPSKGNPPPGNKDGRPTPEPTPDGRHKKDPK
ncbi:hypothetical protein EHYA_06843 [Embleya hyalina]|uniref:Uncharacterized protein n=1 Tax=Embleya hyalina TaxID=516124 RepID=A0A401YX31_9ACTN|nr:hypothetical protein EHYA_06843 [Embleya hyalina]